MTIKLCYLYFVLFVICCFHKLYAQNPIDNEILYPHKSEHLKSFCDKIKHIEKTKIGKIHILQIGDSHIQNDVFGKTVRTELQSKYGNAGLGWIFPYTVLKTNNPITYTSSGSGNWLSKRAIFENVKSTWGICPIALETNDETASLHFTLKTKTENNKVERLALFYGGTLAEAFTPIFKSSGKKFFANQFVDNAIWFDFNTKVADFSLFFEKKHELQANFLLNGMYVESGESGVIYSTVGANGADIAAYQRGEKFGVNLQQLAPDMVIVSLGTNDYRQTAFNEIDFHKNLLKFINEIKKNCPQAVILITTPPLSKSADIADAEKKMNVTADIIRKMAQSEDLLLWDFFAMMKQQKSFDAWLKEEFMSKDALHLTSKGYKTQGLWFSTALMKLLNNFQGTKK